jgi:pilus assembly protein CpaB
VVVATTQLHFGNNIRREHLRLVEWPASSVPEGSFAAIDELLGEKVDKNGKKTKIERVVLRPMEKNEPVLKTKVSGFGGRASLSALITPGMRATTIRMNDVNGVSGFVLPGDRVDILLTRNQGGAKKSKFGLTTDIFLQNMKVLGIAQDANENRNKPMVVRTVTLETTPLQAQKLTLAQKVGTLSLSLRNVTNDEAEKPQTVSLKDLKIGEINESPEPGGGIAGENSAVVSAPATIQLSPVVEVVEATDRATAEKRSDVVTKVTNKKKVGISVRIVRGLTAKEYEVQPEKPSFSAPAYSKPLNLLPSKLAPVNAQAAPVAAPSMPSLTAPTMKLSPPAKKLTAPKIEFAPTAPASMETAADEKSLAAPKASSEPISLLKKGSGDGDDG